MNLGTSLINHVRKWWRPLTCLAIMLTMLTHGVLIPVWNIWFATGVITDLNSLSVLITAIAATFAVREWGKAKGNE